MKLPSDPVILLSTVNTLLRDRYPSIDALCEDMEADREEIIRALKSIDYQYDPSSNRFL